MLFTLIHIELSTIRMLVAGLKWTVANHGVHNNSKCWHYKSSLNVLTLYCCYLFNDEMSNETPCKVYQGTLQCSLGFANDIYY